jgi:hypothetical protein
MNKQLSQVDFTVVDHIVDQFSQQTKSSSLPEMAKWLDAMNLNIFDYVAAYAVIRATYYDKEGKP